MAKTDVWMPLFIGDYLADTGRLTTEQHGAYLLLLMDYWRNGPPPDDPQTLAQITHLSPDAWSIAQAKLKHLFSIVDGAWTHKRVEEELAAAKVNKGKAQAKAKAAADARWKKDNKKAPSNASGSAPSTPQAVPEECPSPSPSPPPLNPLSGGALDNNARGGEDDHPTSAPLPTRESPPLSNDPAIQLSVRLRRLGVNAQFTHPDIQDWSKREVSVDVIEAAVRTARERKGDASIAVGYLRPIVEEILNPPEAKPKAAAAWWASDAAILAKGAELSLAPLAGETMQTFKGRIQAAIDNGGKPPAQRSSAPAAMPPPEPRSAKPEGLNLASLVKRAPEPKS